MDGIITCLYAEDPSDLDAYVSRALTLLHPLVGGAALETGLTWHPSSRPPGDILIIETNCAAAGRGP